MNDNSVAEKVLLDTNEMRLAAVTALLQSLRLLLKDAEKYTMRQKMSSNLLKLKWHNMK